MKKIFGFPVYSIKRCIFAEFELQKGKNKHLNLQNLANHASLEVSLGYAKDGVEINEKVIKDNLRIPNLRICPISRDSLLCFLGKRLQFKKYVKIYHDWLHRLRSKIQIYKPNKTLCDYYDTEKAALLDPNGNIMFE